jgi:hypothetical protein
VSQRELTVPLADTLLSVAVPGCTSLSAEEIKEQERKQERTEEEEAEGATRTASGRRGRWRVLRDAGILGDNQKILETITFCGALATTPRWREHALCVWLLHLLGIGIQAEQGKTDDEQK